MMTELFFRDSRSIVTYHSVQDVQNNADFIPVCIQGPCPLISNILVSPTVQSKDSTKGSNPSGSTGVANSVARGFRV